MANPDIVKEGVLVNYGGHTYTFYCPACKKYHPYSVPKWSFNGDVYNPTFKPSLRVFNRYQGKQITVCHLFVTNGVIEYCKDCPHELAGKTVDMIPIADVGEDAF